MSFQPRQKQSCFWRSYPDPALPSGEARASWHLPYGKLAPQEHICHALGRHLLGLPCPRSEVLPPPLPLAFLVPRVTRRQHFEHALDTRRGISNLSRLGGSRTYLRDSPVPDFNYFHILLLILHTCHVMHVYELIDTTSTLYA